MFSGVKRRWRRGKKMLIMKNSFRVRTGGCSSNWCCPPHPPLREWLFSFSELGNPIQVTQKKKKKTNQSTTYLVPCLTTTYRLFAVQMGTDNLQCYLNYCFWMSLYIIFIYWMCRLLTWRLCDSWEFLLSINIYLIVCIPTEKTGLRMNHQMLHWLCNKHLITPCCIYMQIPRGTLLK